MNWGWEAHLACAFLYTQRRSGRKRARCTFLGRYWTSSAPLMSDRLPANGYPTVEEAPTASGVDPVEVTFDGWEL
eukprot:172959-Pleurochrysis_carterae.AAC.1